MLYIRFAAKAPAEVFGMKEYASPGRRGAIPTTQAANAFSSNPLGLGM